MGRRKKEDEDLDYHLTDDCCKLAKRDVKMTSNVTLKMLLEEVNKYRPSKNREYSINLLEKEIQGRKELAEQMKRINKH